MLVTLLLLIFLQQVTCQLDSCCERKDLSGADCSIKTIYPYGEDLIVIHTNGTKYYVKMSKENEIPRSVTRQDDHPPDQEVISFKFDGHPCEFVRDPGKKVISTETYCPPSDNKNKTHFSVDQCDPVVPLVLRNLYNCDNAAHDPKAMSLHHTGVFYNEPSNQFIVGYYRHTGEANNDPRGIKTTIIAWNSHGDKMGSSTIFDGTGITAITGWYVEDKIALRRERVISINDKGYMCFDWRPADPSLKFLPARKSSKFMPQCVPANVLFKCPQSFCHTGLVDEVLYTEFQWNVTKRESWVQHMTITRGNTMYVFRDAVRQASLYPLTRDHPFVLKLSTETEPKRRTIYQFVAAAVAATMQIRTWDPVWKYAISSQIWFFSGESEFMIHNIFHNFGSLEYLFGNESVSFPPKQFFGETIYPKAGFYDEKTKMLTVLTKDQKIVFKIENPYFLNYKIENFLWYMKKVSSGPLSEEEKITDGYFTFNKTLFAKSGQFIWKQGTSWKKSIPILHHEKHNPGGLISTAQCGMNKNELAEFFKAIRASKSDEGRMTLSLESVPDQPLQSSTTASTMGTTENVTTSVTGHGNKEDGIKYKVWVAVTIWILMFFFTSTMVWVYKNRRLLRKTNSADYY
jgi:hypothetical protein